VQAGRLLLDAAAQLFDISGLGGGARALQEGELLEILLCRRRRLAAIAVLWVPLFSGLSADRGDARHRLHILRATLLRLPAGPAQPNGLKPAQVVIHASLMGRSHCAEIKHCSCRRRSEKHARKTLLCSLCTFACQTFDGCWQGHVAGRNGAFLFCPPNAAE